MKIILTCLVTVLLCTALVAPAQENPGSFTNNQQKTTALPGDTGLLSYFSAYAGNDRVMLNWAIEKNKEADRFEVERSDDGKTFTMIALVFGSEQTGLAEYRFFEKLKKIKSFYRLKVIYNGNITKYSNIIIPGISPALN